MVVPSQRQARKEPLGPFRKENFTYDSTFDTLTCPLGKTLVPAGCDGYDQRRKEKVEHPFGHIKENLGVKAFLLRGLKGVKAEASLLCTAFNLRRMITILGVVELILKLNDS